MKKLILTIFLISLVGCVTFEEALQKNDYNVADEILKKNPEEINKFDKYGITPLVNAVLSNKKDNVEFLINKGADINKETNLKLTVYQSDNSGWTAFHYAVYKGNINIINLFLNNNNTNINAKDKKGRTPLFIAYRYNPSLIDVLKQKDANINGLSIPKKCLCFLSNGNELEEDMSVDEVVAKLAVRTGYPEMDNLTSDAHRMVIEDSIKGNYLAILRNTIDYKSSGKVITKTIELKFEKDRKLKKCNCY